MHDETYYRNHQKKTPCDQNTFSWIKTPDEKRNPVDKTEAGVALVGRRYVDAVYVNEDFPHFPYDDWGFRGSLRV